MATAFLAAKRLTLRAGMKMAPFPRHLGLFEKRAAPKSIIILRLSIIYGNF